MVIDALVGGRWGKPDSGVVIAGYGEKDTFPAVHMCLVFHAFAGRVVKTDVSRSCISHQTGAAIVPFAQIDETRTFMEGVAPQVSSFFDKEFAYLIKNVLPTQLSDVLKTELKLDDAKKRKALRIAGEMGAATYDATMRALKQIMSRYYTDRVLEATQFMPKDELAAMAETLVSLVSFRRRVTLASETVGGAIDVAVITKGDGFIWIKRKHYFKPELNHQFFAKYFG